MNSFRVRGRRPRDYDQFFTSKEVACQCMDFLLTTLRKPLPAFDAVVEPSFGDGAFIHAAVAAGVSLQKMLLSDIDAADEKYRLDFLRDELVGSEFRHAGNDQRGPMDTFVRKRKAPEAAVSTKKTAVTIGNPPFGKNSSLAISFFNAAAVFSDVIAFVVPRTFCKASVQDKLDRAFFLAGQSSIPDNGFTFKGEAYNVPCVFQVWTHSSFAAQMLTTVTVPADGLRAISPRWAETPDFEFVAPSHHPDVAVRRVGVNAGRIFTESPHLCSEQSHLFIKVKNRSKVTAVLKQLQSLSLEDNDAKYNTAGCPSISKSEICQLYIEAMSS